MAPASWRVQEGGGAKALMLWCHAAKDGLVPLVSRLRVGMGTLSDTLALGDHEKRLCSALDWGRWHRHAFKSHLRARPI